MFHSCPTSNALFSLFGFADFFFWCTVCVFFPVKRCAWQRGAECGEWDRSLWCVCVSTHVYV